MQFDQVQRDLEERVERLTRELEEARHEQTATADVLKVISRSTFDLQAVLDTLVELAARLCDADAVGIAQQKGTAFCSVANYGLTAEQLRAMKDIQIVAGRGSAAGRAILEGQPVHVPDVLADPEFTFRGILEVRTVLGVPLLREGLPIGVMVLQRKAMRPFTDKQIELATTFADQAVIAIENVRLFDEVQARTRELSDALEQQTATSEVLRVISSSPGELEPVFETMLANAIQLCGAKFGVMWLREGEAFRVIATHGAPAALVEQRRREPLVRPTPGHNLERMMRTKAVVRIPDILADPESAPTLAKFGGAKALVNVPLLKDGDVIGSIVIFRQEAGPFTDKQIELVQNFADQAVIAIENTRLLNELRQRTDDLSEALEQQTATAEVLQTISNSLGELEPVFASMLGNAVRICEAKFGSLYLREGDAFRVSAQHNAPPAFAEERRREPVLRPGPGTALERAVRTKRAVQIADVEAEPAYRSDARAIALIKLAGYRTALFVPMLKEDELIGVIGIFRQEVRPFTDKQIELVKNFASQAVIAIENTRLFNELRESLQQQTATADVLKVISRSTFDLQAVLDTLVELAVRLCQADKAQILRPTREAGSYYSVAHYGHTPEYLKHMSAQTFGPGRGTAVGRAVLERKPVHIHDVLADPEYVVHETARVGGFRTILVVPLLREGLPIGMLAMHRAAVRPFTEKQIELVETFADQAVIAIENVRLFDEVQASTRELSESLGQQTATSEVLSVISSSPGELAPVFQAMLENAIKICEANFGNLFTYSDNSFRVVAQHNAPPAYREFWEREPIVLLGDEPLVPLARLATSKSVVHMADLATEQGYIERHPRVVALVEGARARTMLLVPMLKEGELIGSIVIYRQEVRPFSEKQIELVKNFAAQAVIAIENTRLLNELRESLAQQTATADVLKVISRSTFDLKIVLNTLVESAARLCAADQATITRQIGGKFFRAEAYGFSPEFIEFVRDVPVVPERGSITARALLEGNVIHVADVLADPDYSFAEAQKLGDFRTILGIPMLREGMPIGVLVLTRSEVRPFTDRQIELANTLADQAAIAIENVRLFDEIQDKNRQLQMASENKSQFVSSMSHELRTPLNAIIGLTDMLVTNAARFGTEKAMEPLQRVNRAGTHLLGLINQVLDLSKIEAGKLELNPQTVQLAPLIEEVIGTARQLAEQNKNRLILNAQENLGALTVDPLRLRQILLNLLSNALQVHQGGRGQATGAQDGRWTRRDRAFRFRYWHRHDAGAAGKAV